MSKPLQKALEDLVDERGSIKKVHDAFDVMVRGIAKAYDENQTKRERVEGEIRRGSRAGKGRFRL